VQNPPKKKHEPASRKKSCNDNKKQERNEDQCSTLSHIPLPSPKKGESIFFDRERDYASLAGGKAKQQQYATH